MCLWVENLGSCEGDLWFEPFCEWGGHRTNGQRLLQLTAKPVEENLCQELQHCHREPRVWHQERWAQRGSSYWARFKLCPAFSQVQEMGWKEAKCDRLYVWLFCTPSCKHCLFFPYIPAWNHTLVVCFVISFGAERRQENFLLDGLKGSVLYTTWVTRTMSDQSAVKWMKVTAQSERDEFSRSARARGRHELALPESSPRWLGQNSRDGDENTATAIPPPLSRSSPAETCVSLPGELENAFRSRSGKGRSLEPAPHKYFLGCSQHF